MGPYLCWDSYIIWRNQNINPWYPELPFVSLTILTGAFLYDINIMLTQIDNRGGFT